MRIYMVNEAQDSFSVVRSCGYLPLAWRKDGSVCLLRYIDGWSNERDPWDDSRRGLYRALRTISAVEVVLQRREGLGSTYVWDIYVTVWRGRIRSMGKETLGFGRSTIVIALDSYEFEISYNSDYNTIKALQSVDSTTFRANHRLPLILNTQYVLSTDTRPHPSPIPTIPCSYTLWEKCRDLGEKCTTFANSAERVTDGGWNVKDASCPYCAVK